MTSDNTQSNNDNQKTKMEDKPTKSSSSMSSVLKVLILGVVVVCLGTAIAVPLWLTLSADNETTVTVASSTQAILNTTTIRTITAATVITTTASTTTIILPYGNITYQYNENSTVYLACTNWMNITIRYAFFGVLSCADCSCSYCLCSNMTVTSTVNALCQNLPWCSFNAYYTVLGNPCPSYSKTFLVTYYCS